MYVNALIGLEENMPTYGMGGKKVNGHVTITTPGIIKCYVQNLSSKDNNMFVLYAFASKEDKGVRIGTLISPKESRETRWQISEQNIMGSGIKAKDIDAVAIVKEGDGMRNTDTILIGFARNKYRINDLLQDLLPIEKNLESIERPITPIHGPTTPITGVIMPTQGPTTPMQGTTMPMQGTMVPTSQGPITPIQGPTTPMQGTMVPTSQGPITPIQGPTTPMQGTMVPTSQGPITPIQGPAGATPGGMGMTPGMMGSAPGGMGTTPGMMGSAPGGMGTTPGMMGATPGGMGTTPGMMGSAQGGMGTTQGMAGSTPGITGSTQGGIESILGMLCSTLGITGPTSGMTGSTQGGIESILEMLCSTLGTTGPTPGMTGPTPGMIGPTPGMTGPTPGMTGPTQGMMGTTPGMMGATQGMTGPTQGMTGPTQGMTGPTQGITGLTPGMMGSMQGSVMGRRNQMAPTQRSMTPTQGIDEEELDELEEIREDEKICQWQIEKVLQEAYIKQQNSNNQLDMQGNNIGSTQKSLKKKDTEPEDQLMQGETPEEMDYLEEIERKLKDIQARLKISDTLERSMKNFQVSGDSDKETDREQKAKRASDVPVEEIINKIVEFKNNMYSEGKPYQASNSDDNLERLYNSSARVYPFEYERDNIEWVRISLADLSSISTFTHQWCTQPFITFSYYKYNEIILGKEKGIGQYYIGIPDIYHPERKNILDTDTKVEKFACQKLGAPAIGEYGYWLIRL